MKLDLSGAAASLEEWKKKPSLFIKELMTSVREKETNNK